MTSSNKLIVLFVLALTACTPAKSPLGAGDGATFAILPDRVRATAELQHASDENFGKATSQILHFAVCLQSLATGQSVANGTPFAIGDASGTEIERAADPNGCIHWNETHAVSPLAPERNVRLERRVRAVRNHRGTVNLVFNVKPWLEGGDAVQAELNQENYADAIRGKLNFTGQYPIRSEVAATAADLDTSAHFDLADNQIELSYVEIARGREFEIDDFLNLTVPYRYSYSFTPRVTRRLFSGAMKSEPLTSGKLRVTFVFLASSTGDFTQDTQYLTSAQTEVNVSAGGRVSGVLQVKYPHMLYASGRQTVLMEIAAPAQGAVEPRAFAGSLSAVDHQGGLTVVADERDAELIHRDSTRVRAENAARRGKPFDEFLNSRGNLVRSNVDVLPSERARSRTGKIGKFVDWLTSSWSPLAGKLCRAYLKLDPLDPAKPFDPATKLELNDETTVRGLAPEYILCDPGYNVREAVNIQRLSFVERIVEKAPRNVDIRTYSNMDFATYTTRDAVDAHQISLGLNFSAPLPWGTGVSAAATASHADVHTRGGKFGESQTVAVDVGRMEVFASTRECLLVSATNAIAARPPWLICETKTRPPSWHPEHFYYFSQMFGSNHSPFIDPFNAESGIKFLIRGNVQMRNLTRQLEDADIRESGFNVFIQVHAPNFSESDTLGPVDHLTNQAVPGAFELK